MKSNKLALGLGWFGILTPLIFSGALLVLWANGVSVSSNFTGLLIMASGLNFIGGYKILKKVAREKQYAKAKNA